MHMGVVMLLVVLFFGSVLLISYTELERNSDSRLVMLSRVQGMPQGITIISSDIGTAQQAFPAGQTRAEMRLRVMPGIAISTEDGVNIRRIESTYDMDDDFYTRVTNAAYGKHKTSGKLRVDGYDLKFLYNGDDLYLIDITRETQMISGMFGSFLLIALPLMALIFLVSLFFANRSIRPIEASYNRQKEFIADASHELKTPLTTISTNLDVLSATAEPEQLKWMGYIHSEVQRMTGLTNSLLYLAKMDYGAVGESLPVDMDKLLADLWLPLEAVLYEKGIVSNSEIEPGVYVRGDGEQLRKLIGILTDNAVRYTENAINITLTKTQNHAVLSITSNGPGIPAAEQDKIWERFYRSNQARPGDGGFGLGLPMAKAITERHKGRITCVSTAEGPTVFTVKLPLCENH